MEFLNTMLRFFQQGGHFMYPIAIALVFGLAIVLERWLFLTRTTSANRRAFERMLPMLRKKDFLGAQQLVANNKVPICRIVASGISRMSQTPRRNEIEAAMEEGMMETLPRLEKRTQYLATLANIATLLGLLGTIIGLIAAFTAVANADPTEKATLLSQSISVAMNTTAFGLMAAIPLLLAHSMLQTKTTEIIDSLDMATVKCLNLLSGESKAQARTRSNDPATSSNKSNNGGNAAPAPA
ncbi:MotA/TolQ/ExbB proton channel family protein [Porticoccus sp. W117]|uniref:MotA/TolQ/ExbB proton channel family protein n=1 Tax=Porticoccus sp. W117 TaxID=3054777 RepID=UPI002594482E|nr:MotA/TolQ/ExbB proton channel family protein [Porticoccus sp. W117]MDM3872237.1 MotA/TolQ/ExbB proton channel family protein [Porticoccus sp. W117]